MARTKSQKEYRWMIRDGKRLLISVRKSALEATEEARIRDYFGSWSRVEFVSLEEVKSLVEDCGCTLVDLDAE